MFLFYRKVHKYKRIISDTLNSLEQRSSNNNRKCYECDEKNHHTHVTYTYNSKTSKIE